MTTYSKTTEDITVSVKPVYIEQESNVFLRKFTFAYFIRIENHGKETVQLLRRHWFISHDTGKIEEVEGEGVVGRQPIIAPGKFHEYNSFCILESLEGFMEGTYLMMRPNGDKFSIVIPKFTLRAMVN